MRAHLAAIVVKEISQADLAAIRCNELTLTSYMLEQYIYRSFHLTWCTCVQSKPRLHKAHNIGIVNH